MKKKRSKTISAVLNARLDAAQIHFNNHIRATAIIARAVILPYFSQKRLTYRLTVGGHAWIIEDEAGVTIRNFELPPRIRSVLLLQVGGYEEPLGLWIEKITPSDWIQLNAKKDVRTSTRKVRKKKAAA